MIKGEVTVPMKGSLRYTLDAVFEGQGWLGLAFPRPSHALLALGLLIRAWG